MWEPTATKLENTPSGKTENITSDQQHEAIGLARIAIKATVNPASWGKFRYLSTLPLTILSSIENFGHEVGADPRDWFCLFYDISSSYWDNVEVWDGRRWVEYAENMEKEIYLLENLPEVANGKLFQLS